MSDTWILKHADIFEPTRTSRHTASRLDRIYITQALIQQLENCQVVTLSPELSHISDHKPVSVTIKGNSGRVSNENMWKMNAALLHDIQSQEEIKTEIQRTIQAHNTQLDKTWDELKEWREISKTAGQKRCIRTTKTLNEILRRIRIIERRGELTFTTQEYIDMMKTKYDETIRESSKASQTAVQLKLSEDECTDALYAHNTTSRESKQTRITEIRTRDG